MNGAPPPGSTNTPPQRPERVLAIAALAAILFLQPFLGIFDKGAGLTWAGIPALFAYIFFAWSVIVALTAFVMERRAEAEHDASLVFHADDPQRNLYAALAYYRLSDMKQAVTHIQKADFSKLAPGQMAVFAGIIRGAGYNADAQKLVRRIATDAAMLPEERTFYDKANR